MCVRVRARSQWARKPQACWWGVTWGKGQGSPWAPSLLSPRTAGPGGPGGAPPGSHPQGRAGSKQKPGVARRQCPRGHNLLPRPGWLGTAAPGPAVQKRWAEGLGKRKRGGRWLGRAVVLEHWDKFPGAETIHQRRGSAALFLLPPASVYPGDINGTGRTRHRSLTLLGPEDSEGQWQVKNFKRALSWPARGQTPLGCRGVLSPLLLTALPAPTDAAGAMNSPEGPSFPARLLSGGASPSGDEGFFPFVLERRDSFLGGGPGPEEPEDLALQLQQKEKDLLLAAELGKMLLEHNEELQRQLDTLSAQHAEREEVSWRQRAGLRSGGQGAGTRPGAEGRKWGRGLPLEQQSRARTSLPGSVAQ